MIIQRSKTNFNDSANGEPLLFQGDPIGVLINTRSAKTVKSGGYELKIQKSVASFWQNRMMEKLNTAPLAIGKLPPALLLSAHAECAFYCRLIPSIQVLRSFFIALSSLVETYKRFHNLPRTKPYAEFFVEINAWPGRVWDFS